MALRQILRAVGRLGSKIWKRVFSRDRDAQRKGQTAEVSIEDADASKVGHEIKIILPDGTMILIPVPLEKPTNSKGNL